MLRTKGASAENADLKPVVALTFRDCPERLRMGQHMPT
jgi:hypothetical protein